MLKIITLTLVTSFILYSTALAVGELGVLNVEIVVGKVASVGLNPSSSGNWFVGPNSNSKVATGVIKSGDLFLSGNEVGQTVIKVCTDTNFSSCLEVNAIVKPLGSVLGAFTEASHSANSWVISGKTVFYINSDGIIPISTWAIFINNGGKQSLIQSASPGDFKLPLLGLMEMNDSRVKK